MPFATGGGGIHDDGYHTASAKRGVANGVASLDASIGVPASELALAELLTRKNAANGYAGLDAGSMVALAQIPLRLRCGLLGTLAWADMTVVQGNWQPLNTIMQTDWDDIWVTQAGAKMNFSGDANLDEIKVPAMVLNAGTYEINVVVWTENNGGILEVLHGATSVGTNDTYSVAPTHNVVKTYTYSPTVRTAADLRFRVNGKNASSTAYFMRISRIQIRKTA